MLRRPARSTRIDTLVPYTTLFRSDAAVVFQAVEGDGAADDLDRQDTAYAYVCQGRYAHPCRAVFGHLRLNASRRSEEHTSELQSLMRNSYAVFCLKKIKRKIITCLFTLIQKCTHNLVKLLII